MTWNRVVTSTATPSRRSETLVCFFVGAAISAAVGFGALSGQRLLLLDWVTGPHSRIPAAVWGLEGGVLNGLPFTVVMLGLNQAVGALASWLPLLAFFPLGMVGMARLLEGCRLEARIASGLLYVVNPLVFERAHVGHFAILTGYALLPALVRRLRLMVERDWFWVIPAGILAAACVAVSAHFAWIAGVLLALTLLSHPGWRSLKAVLGAGVIVALLSAYLVVVSSGDPPGRIGLDDLATYRTTGDPTFGLFGNVLGLYGFWRQAATPLPKSVVGGWPFVLLAMLLLIGLGIFEGHRLAGRRRLARLALGSSIIGFTLTLGDQGPLGSLYRWAFVHVPLFAVMREPQKFIVLLALGYAICFGWGVDAAVDRLRGTWARRVMVGAALALPLIYTPSLFVGTRGGMQGTRIPSAWESADHVIGTGTGRVLALPWHQYLSFPFTKGVIANPIEGLIRREVIAGDNVEVARIATSSTLARSRYLEYLYANGDQLCRFGSLIAPLGVEFVILAKTVDFASYAWLNDQADLAVVLDRPELVLFRNTSWQPTLGPSDPITVEGWADLATRANRGEDVGVARLSVAGRGDETSAVPPPPVLEPTGCAGSIASTTAASVARTSLVSYDIETSGSGVVALPELFDRGWGVDGRSPTVKLAGGTLGARVAEGHSEVEFRPWTAIRAAYVLTAIGCVALLIAFLWFRRSDAAVRDG